MFRKIWRQYRTQVISFLSKYSSKNLIRLMYLESYKRLPNLRNPKLFSEKIFYFAINEYFKSELVAKCADKLAVRDFVKELGYEKILIKLHGVWSNAYDIDWDILPQKFVLKCNHGSGYNIICNDKEKLNKEQTISKLNNWLSDEYWKRSGELFYKNIPPRIICEEYIETNDGYPPRDYKFFCSYGKVKFLFVAQERVANGVKFDFFTPTWERIPVKDHSHPTFEGDIVCPNTFSEMIKIAEDLSKKWGLVRVDFYSEGNIIYFGEITFMHKSGRPHFTPSEYDRIFGEMFVIDNGNK